jgi:hypothetical protein
MGTCAVTEISDSETSEPAILPLDVMNVDRPRWPGRLTTTVLICR